MARLESQRKKGYYKTPSHLISLIAQYLTIEGDEKEKEEIRLLDPCCGEGEALSLLGQELGLSSFCLYGNELDEDRFAKARERIPNCLCGDAIFELKASSGGFSLLYENPPYDFDKEHFRTEFNFLQAHYRFLANNGILVYIVPESILSHEKFVKTLPVWFKDIRIFRFPPEDYSAFKQVVVFGRKKRLLTKKEEQNYLFQLKNPLTLGDPCDIVYKLPKVRPSISFFSLNISSHDASELMKNKTVKHILDVGVEKNSQEKKVKSLMTLRSGHQALLLASGIMDGAYYRSSNNHILVIHGDVEQEIIEKVEDDVDVTIYKTLKKPKAHIIAIDLSETKEKGELVITNLE